MTTSFPREEERIIVIRQNDFETEIISTPFRPSIKKMDGLYIQKMVMQKTLFDKEQLDPEKEISVLYALGLEDYEVEYLLLLKTKKEISKKWID